MKESFFKKYNNKLECICLLTTEKEILNQNFKKFIKNLTNNTEKESGRDLIFNIILNKKTNIEIAILEEFFKEVNVLDLNLNKEQDIYVKSISEIPSITKFPIHGFKSGPNVVFFKTIELCAKYNTTLFLETDCLLYKNWLSRIKNYIENANGFWISGGLYDGDLYNKNIPTLQTHINGGTGIYATGCFEFQEFIKRSEVFLIKKINQGIYDLAYDCSIRMFIDENIRASKNSSFWRFINRNYLPNKLIGNFSLENNPMSLEDIQNRFDFAIIHKK